MLELLINNRALGLSTYPALEYLLYLAYKKKASE